MTRQHFTQLFLFLGAVLGGLVCAQAIDFTPAMTPAAETACNVARGVRTILGPSIVAIFIVIGWVMIGQKNANGWILVGSGILGLIFLFVMPQIFAPVLPGCTL